MHAQQVAGSSEQRLIDETVELCAAAAANSAYQGKAFFEDATRDYRRLWETLPGATPEGALGAWQAFWAARTASYLGAAFRAAAAPTVEVETAAAKTADFRLPA